MALSVDQHVLCTKQEFPTYFTIAPCSIAVSNGTGMSGTDITTASTVTEGRCLTERGSSRLRRKEALIVLAVDIRRGLEFGGNGRACHVADDWLPDKLRGSLSQAVPKRFVLLRLRW